MTSVDIAALVYELNQEIKDARIENIYQINPMTLLLRLYLPNQPTRRLLIEAGKRTHLTSYVLKKPFKPPAFCMALRKYLKNGRIQEMLQHEFERTIVFKVGTRDGVFQLIAEMFGEGNIILTNPEGVIVTAHTYKRMRDRNIIRSEIFNYAPSSGENPFSLKRTQMDELKKLGRLEIVRGLTKFLSIGGLYAEELLLRADVDKNTPCENLTNQQLDAVFIRLKAMLSQLNEGRFDPAIIIDGKGAWTDVTPILLRKYEALKRTGYKTFNNALDEYYTQTRLLQKVFKAQKEHERELAKQQRIVQDQEKTLEDSKKAKERNKHIGDLIYKRLGELQLLLQEIFEEKQKGKTWEQIVNKLKEEKLAKRTQALYFDSLDEKRQILNISIGDEVFPIKINRTAQANAADYYEKMKKAERKLLGSEKALLETKTRIEELQKQWTKKIEEVREGAPPKQVKKAWYEKFRWFYSSDDFLIVGGKDAITNEILIKKHLESHDVVFHADIVGAPFTVVKTQGKAPTEQVIQEAAQFAASHSRAWREMLSTIDVYWVHPNQLSKNPPHGQYLQKGAFVIQGMKNYVRGVELRVGIGVQMREGQLTVIRGPAQAVSRQTSFYVEIMPGRQPSSALVKKIRALLIEKAPKNWREKILAVPNVELQGFAPFGKGEVILK